MIIYVDIDETICHYNLPTTNINYTNINIDIPRDYNRAIPIDENIAKVNSLYDLGHHIVYWTARGTKTGIDWTDITRAQLLKWGAKYHELKMGKPYYDLLIDDKAMTNFDNLQSMIHD
jgi:hypothetical protein